MNAKIVEHYTELKILGELTGFEMVYVSLDKTEAAFSEFYKTMPCLAVPYANTDARDGLMKVRDSTH